jgi:hypothetical protein
VIIGPDLRLLIRTPHIQLAEPELVGGNHLEIPPSKFRRREVAEVGGYDRIRPSADGCSDHVAVLRVRQPTQALLDLVEVSDAGTGERLIHVADASIYRALLERRTDHMDRVRSFLQNPI